MRGTLSAALGKPPAHGSLCDTVQRGLNAPAYSMANATGHYVDSAPRGAFSKQRFVRPRPYGTKEAAG